MATAFELFGKIKLDSTSLDKGLKESLASGVAWGNIMSNVASAATRAFVSFVDDSIKTGMEFDSSMSQLAATMGTTADSIGELRDFAREMGATTAFTATQAAEGLNVLAMAGYDAERQMETLPTVLNLAAAGNLDLANSADYLTTVMAGFADQGLEVADVADLMAKMASSAKGSVSDFGSGLAAASAMASTTRQELDTVATALALLGNHGLSAAEGGNALNRALRNLYQPVSTSKEALDELGVSAYTAEGEARPLRDVLVDLNDAMEGWSDEARNQYLSQIFDAYTLKSIGFLLDGVAEGAEGVSSEWDAMATTLEDRTGAAADMAAEQLDNLAGDVTKFKSALDEMKLTLNDELSPYFRTFTQTATEGLNNMTAALKEEGLAGGLRELLVTIAEEGDNLWDIILGEDLPARMKDELDAAKDAVRAAIESGDYEPAWMKIGRRDGKSYAKSAKEGIEEGVDEEAPQWSRHMVDTTVAAVDSNLWKVGNEAVTLVDTHSEGVRGQADLLHEDGAFMVVTMDEGYTSVYGGFEQRGEELADYSIAGVGNREALLSAAGSGMVDATGLGYGQSAPDGQLWGNSLADYTASGATDSYAQAVLAAAGSGMVDAVGSGVPTYEAETWGIDLMQSLINGIYAKMPALDAATTEVASKVQKKLGFSEPEEGPLSDFHTYAPDMIDLFIQGIRENEQRLHDQIASTFDLRDIISGGGQDMVMGSGYAAASGRDSERGSERPAVFQIQVVADKRVLGEAAFEYSRNKLRAIGG